MDTWASDLATCLVGVRVDLDGTSPDAAAVLAAMEAKGWAADAIRQVAHECVADERPWPFPAPRDVVSRGPAQWYALVGAARALLSLDGDVRSPSTRTALTADERRLLQDVPPHW